MFEILFWILWMIWAVVGTWALIILSVFWIYLVLHDD